MTVSYTTNMLMGKPTVANSYNVWGAELNTLIEIIDKAVFSNNFAEDTASHTGLNFYYKNGRVQNGTTTTKVSGSYITLTDNQTNYIEVNKSGTVSKNTSGFSDDSIPLYTVVCASGSQGTATDHRNYLAPASLWTKNSDSMDSTYNLMLGTGSKKTWGSTYNYMQLGGNGSISYSKTAAYPSYLYISNNLYWDVINSRWEVITAGQTSQIVLTTGRVYIKTGADLAADADAALLNTAVFDQERNLLLGGATSPQTVAGFGQGCISLKNLTEPTVVTSNQLDLFCTNDANVTLGMLCEESVAADTDETQFSHKFRIQINGTAYYIMLIQV